MTIQPWKDAAKENGSGYMNYPYYMGLEITQSRAELRRQQSEIIGLKGEAGVLRGLLRECLNVMDTIDGADLDESDRLGDLHEKICAAIEFK